jgi:hypothetical protein
MSGGPLDRRVKAALLGKLYQDGDATDERPKQADYWSAREVSADGTDDIDRSFEKYCRESQRVFRSGGRPRVDDPQGHTASP